MKSETSTTVVLKVMNVLFWIVFVGLCIKIGSLLTSLVISLVNTEAITKVYMGLNLSELLNHDKVDYIITMSLVISISIMKAIIAYLVVKISMQLNLVKPFSEKVLAYIINISYMALFAGILAHLARNYTKGLSRHGISVPIQWNEAEILFFAGIIFIIAQVFKKGIELQTENELTV